MLRPLWRGHVAGAFVSVVELLVICERAEAGIDADWCVTTAARMIFECLSEGYETRLVPRASLWVPIVDGVYRVRCAVVTGDFFEGYMCV